MLFYLHSQGSPHKALADMSEGVSNVVLFHSGEITLTSCGLGGNASPAQRARRTATSSDRVARARPKVVNAYQRPALRSNGRLVKAATFREDRPRG